MNAINGNRQTTSHTNKIHVLFAFTTICQTESALLSDPEALRWTLFMEEHAGNQSIASSGLSTGPPGITTRESDRKADLRPTFYAVAEEAHEAARCHACRRHKAFAANLVQRKGGCHSKHGIPFQMQGKNQKY